MWSTVLLILLVLIFILSVIKISMDLHRKRPRGFVVKESVILLLIIVVLVVVDTQLARKAGMEKPAGEPGQEARPAAQTREAQLLSELQDYTGVLADIDKPQVQFYLEQGQTHRANQQYSEALDVFEQALDLELSDEERLPFFVAMGNCETHLKEYNAAINYYYQGERIGREAENDTALMVIYSNLALAHRLADEPEGALESYFDLLRLFRQLGDKQGEKNTLANIGFIYQTQGNADSASFYHQKSLEIPTTEMGLLAEAAQMNNLALAYRSRGMLDSALALHQQALLLFQRAGDKKDEASVLVNMGLIYQEREDLDRAMQHYRSAFEIDSTMGNVMGQASDLTNMGSVFEQGGKPTEAEDFYQRALLLFETMEAKREAEFVRQNIQRVQRKLKQ